MSPLPENVFYDINKLPAEKGLLIFPISMSRIETGQSPETCFKYIPHLALEKFSTPTIGLNFIYTDFLYMTMEENSASKAKTRMMSEMMKHKNGIQNLIAKNKIEFQIQHGFHFQTWSQLYIQTQDFILKLKELRKIYDTDSFFQKYIQEDADHFFREVSEQQIMFFLEEHLMAYLITKGQIIFDNDYIQHQEQWLLYCYPGFPPKAHVYLYQLNPFKLDNPKNKYQNAFYDLEKKKLYEFDRLNLKTWNYE